jgi:hypothetical protein
MMYFNKTAALLVVDDKDNFECVLPLASLLPAFRKDERTAFFIMSEVWNQLFNEDWWASPSDAQPL